MMANAIGRGMILVLAASALSADAQVFDHLKCSKVADSQPKAKYQADLNGPLFDAGCVIKVPGVLFCAPTIKQNVTPPPPASGNGPSLQSMLCYKVKCPKGVPLTTDWSDQFGTRTVSVSAPKLLCAPALVSTTTTTTP